MPRPPHRLSTDHQIPREHVIGSALGEPARPTGTGLVIQGTPAQGGAYTLQRLWFRGATFRDLPKEHKGEIQWAGQIMRNGDRSWESLRQKATLGPQGTALDGKAAPRRIAAASHDFSAVSG